jgi:SH3-like domain-containing protein
MGVVSRMVAGLRWVAVGLGAAVLAGAPPLAPPADAQGTGLPLPRFVSLKASRVNVRIGPSNEHAVKWIFVRSGLPVEIVQEFENWRRIRDSSGAEGWVYHGLLSGRRTALVAPWQNAEPTALYARGDATSKVKATLSPNVVVQVRECDGRWCEVEGPNFEGFVEQAMLWGVYPDETVH